MIHPGAKPVGVTATETVAGRVSDRHTSGVIVVRPGLSDLQARMSERLHRQSEVDIRRLTRTLRTYRPRPQRSRGWRQPVYSAGRGTLFANARRYCASYYYAEEWKAFS